MKQLIWVQLSHIAPPTPPVITFHLLTAKVIPRKWVYYVPLLVFITQLIHNKLLCHFHVI